MALLAAGVFTSVFALIWVTSLPDRFVVDVNDPYVRQANLANEEEETKGFFESLKDSFGSNVANVNSASDTETADEIELMDLNAIMRDGAPVEAPEPGDVVVQQDNVIIIGTSSASDSVAGE